MKEVEEPVVKEEDGDEESVVMKEEDEETTVKEEREDEDPAVKEEGDDAFQDVQHDMKASHLKQFFLSNDKDEEFAERQGLVRSEDDVLFTDLSGVLPKTEKEGEEFFLEMLQDLTAIQRQILRNIEKEEEKIAESLENVSMDKKKKQLTPRMEKRLKWYQEQKSAQRVTRAKAGEKETHQNTGNNTSKTETSNRGFKSKLIPSKQQQQQNSKKAANNSFKKSHTAIKNEKKTVNNSDDPKVKVEPQENDSSSEAKNGNKVNKKPYVDAVEKLENTTSVHTPKRYVLFVGNLPKNITKEQVEEHFKKTGGVKAVRIPKHKGTEETRGFAYVEFTSTISHRIALRLHNTTLGGRKINVEFTSEGNKSKSRMDGLREKNEKLAKYKMPFDT